MIVYFGISTINFTTIIDLIQRWWICHDVTTQSIRSYVDVKLLSVLTRPMVLISFLEGHILDQMTTPESLIYAVPINFSLVHHW